MRSNKKTIVVIISVCFFSSFCTYLFCKNNFIPNTKTLTTENQDLIALKPDEHNQGNRSNGYEYIKPLLSDKKATESVKLANLKSKINNFIEENKSAGILISASVYLQVFDQEDWMCINENENYLPGSLIKVAGLLTYLRMEEAHPGILDKKLSFSSPDEIIPNQTFNSKQLIYGKEYTIRELLKYMISYSDNNATYLLNKNVDLDLFMNLFTDLHIPPPDLTNKNFEMKPKDYALFFEVIYNSSYLSFNHSELAAELLAQCDFKEGMVKGLPANTKIIHKFGEMGDATTRQLHESGIIYLNNTPYLLTIMTKGYDIKKLPAVISQITKITCDEISKKQSL